MKGSNPEISRLDETLEGFDVTAPWWEWRSRLRDSGLLYGPALPGVPGKRLADLQAAVAAWEAVEQGARRWALLTRGLAVGCAVGAFAAGAWGSDPSALGLGLAAVFSAMSASRHPLPVLGKEAGHSPLMRLRAQAALEALQMEPFVAAQGERVVENSPARAQIRARQSELDQVLGEQRRRIAEMQATLSALAGVAGGAGDVETGLHRGIAMEQARHASTLTLRAELDGVLVRVETEIAGVRAHATRDALEERASRLLGGTGPSESARALAEVDLAEVDARLKQLRDHRMA